MNHLTKEQRAETLHATGYSAELAAEFVIVTTPDGRPYRLDPRRLTCTCTDFATRKQACKHLLGLQGLLLDTAATIDDNGPGCLQDVQWGAYTDEGLRRRAAVVELCDLAAAVRNRVERLAGEREQRWDAA